MGVHPRAEEYLSTILRMQNERIDKVFWIIKIVGRLNVALFFIGELILVSTVFIFNIRIATYFATIGGSLELVSPTRLFWFDVLVAVIPATIVLNILWSLIPNWGYWLMWFYCRTWYPSSYSLEDLELYQQFKILGSSAFHLPGPSWD